MYIAGIIVCCGSFLPVNHHNHKNWVPSILTHNLWLIFMGMKQNGWIKKTEFFKTHINALCINLFISYEIKSPPWTILWFRILGISSVESIMSLCVFMFQTWDNSQLLRRVLWISAELTIVWSLKHKNTQPLYIFNRVKVLHLDRLKEGTWLHSFDLLGLQVPTYLWSNRLDPIAQKSISQ